MPKFNYRTYELPAEGGVWIKTSDYVCDETLNEIKSDLMLYFKSCHTTQLILRDDDYDETWSVNFEDTFQVNYLINKIIRQFVLYTASCYRNKVTFSFEYYHKNGLSVAERKETWGNKIVFATEMNEHENKQVSTAAV